MIVPEGRVLSGLDEFMLRLGHLTVTCISAADVGNSRYRLEDHLAKALTSLITIEPERNAALAEYLSSKRLIPPDTDEKSKARYPDLRIEKVAGELRLINVNGEQPAIWWQDYQLADERVPSKVGGITVRAKSGSKSVLSHVIDWAMLLDLMSQSGSLTTWGKLLYGVFKSGTSTNPYVLGAERLVLAWCVLRADFDLLGPLCIKISNDGGTLRRQEATALFVKAVEELDGEARTSRRTSRRHADAVYAAYQDLAGAANRSRRPIESTSTAWHRASSRYESLVDIGLLSKADGPAAPYVYQYAPTAKLHKLTGTLEANVDADAWFDDYFSAVLGPDGAPVTEGFVEENLPEAHSLLQARSSLVQIDPLLVALLVVAQRLGFNPSLGALRRMLHEYVRNNPSVARLSSGRYGRKAEFVSLRMKRNGR